MPADLIVDERKLQCVWRCNDCGTKGRAVPIERAAQVAALADRHNQQHHAGDPMLLAHEVNWTNARYAMRHHAPAEWDSTVFDDEQQRSQSLWLM